MKRITRALSVVLSLVLAIGLAACGNGSGETTAPTSEQAAETTETQDPAAEETGDEEEITLVYTTWVNNKDAEGNYVEEKAAEAFTAKYPHIKVDVNIVSENNNEEAAEKQDLMILGNETIDVALYGVRSAVADRVARNMLTPLDEYYTGDNAYDKLYTVSGEIDGQIYGIPTEVKSAFVMINQSYLDEAGLPVPEADWTWDDFREYAEQLTVGEGAEKRYGSYFHTWTDYKVFGLKNAYPHWIFLTEDGQSNMTDPELKDWMEFVHSMETEDGSLLPYFEAKSTSASYRDLFFRGKIAMLPIGTWMVPEIASTLDEYPHEWVTTFASVPQWKDYPAGASQTNPEFVTIPVTSQHVEEAVLFANFLCSEEGAMIRASGDPSVVEYDIEAFMDKKMQPHPELYDAEALVNVYDNMVKIDQTNVFGYTSKVNDAADVLLERYMLGEIGIDEALAEADSQVTQIVNAAD